MRTLASGLLLVALAGLSGPTAAGFEQRIDPGTPVDQKVLLSPAAERIATITPGADSEPVRPGATVHRTVTLQNRTSGPIVFELSVGQVVGSSAEEVVDVRHGVREGAAAWVSLERQTLTLPSRAEARVQVTIRIPKEVTPGSKSFAVTATQRAPTAAAEAAAVTPIFRQVAIFVVDLPGDAPSEGAISKALLHNSRESDSQDSQSRVFVGGHPLTLAIEFRNEGEVLLTPAGIVEVRPLFGHTRTYRVPRLTVYPGGEAAAEIELKGLPRLGFVRTKLVMSSDSVSDEKLLPGVLLAPAWFLAGLLVTVGLAGLWIATSLRRRSRHRRSLEYGFEDAPEDPLAAED